MGGGGKGGGGGSTNMDVKVSGSTTVLSDVDINGLDNIKTDNTSRLVLSTPQSLASKAELAVTEPIVTDATAKLDATVDATGKLDTNSALSLDIKPLVSDACVRLELGKVPPTRVCQPYRGHVGFTLFGVEIFGVTASGEAQVIIEDLPRRPDVVWADDEPRHRVAPSASGPAGPAPRPPGRGPAGGLRIHLGP